MSYIWPKHDSILVCSCINVQLWILEASTHDQVLGRSFKEWPSGLLTYGKCIWIRYVGSAGGQYPGLYPFLHQCNGTKYVIC